MLPLTDLGRQDAPSREWKHPCEEVGKVKDSFLFYLFVSLKKIFYYSRVNLQYCVNFCCTAKTPSHVYICGHFVYTHTHTHTHTYTFFFLTLPSIMFCPKKFDIVPCATQ